MPGSFTGKTAVITGAGRGIGRAVALGMHAEGARLAVSSATERSMSSLAEALGSSKGLLALVGDASDEGFVGRAFSSAVSRFGRLNILVNNVGEGLPKPTLELGVEEWDRIMAVNLRSTFLWSKYFAKHVIGGKRRGVIVNVASNLAIIGRKERAPYIASKAGVLGLTRALAAEWGPRGIRVNAVAPGTTQTDRIAKIILSGKSSEEEYVSRVPLGRLATPEEIANVILFLASERASFIHGATIVADGGAAATY
ncbi:MAG: SDR family oxidoreductase [Thaumarchaeota archaeon]|nr:SDR family oxidoreductase [Nitrososphaerota archaeon]